MFGFLIKKNFCDGWDNLFTLVLSNLIFFACGSGVFFAWRFLVQIVPESQSQLVAMLITALGIFLVTFIYNLFAFSFGELAVTIANFGGVHFLDIFKKMPSVLKDVLLFSLLVSALILVSYIGIHWYFTQGSYLYLFMGCMFVWFDFFAIISLQWFVAIRSIMHNPFKKCLKKCLILMLDNTAFSIGFAFYNLILILLSVLFIGFIPSVTGITLAKVNALRLRLYKYDYLELHPELKTKRERKNVPWEELLYEDKETLGPRKFRSFIFPWKDV